MSDAKPDEKKDEKKEVLDVQVYKLNIRLNDFFTELDKTLKMYQDRIRDLENKDKSK